MKDWTGNRKSIYVTLGASNHVPEDRQENDFYATDPTSINDLLKVETFSNRIWEPACGEGHMSKRLEELGKEVYSTDLYNRGFGSGGIDFLECGDSVSPDTDIITNPPYKFAREFCEQAIRLTGNKVAMFPKLTFLEGQKRKRFFNKFPPKRVYVYSQRKVCAKNGRFEEVSSSAIAYAWFIWEKDYLGETKLEWI